MVWQTDGANCTVPGFISLQTLSTCRCRLGLSSSSRVLQESDDKRSTGQRFTQSWSTSSGTAVDVSEIGMLDAPAAVTPSTVAEVECVTGVKPGGHAGHGQPSMHHALQRTLHQVTDCTLQLEAFSKQQHAMQMALQVMTTKMQDSVLLMQQQ